MNASKILKIATLPIKHFAVLHQDESGRTRMSGYKGKFMTVLLEALGIDYQVLVPPDREVGRPGLDGNFTGLLGMVQRSEADLGFILLRVSLKRMQAVDFSRPYMLESFNFVTQKAGHIAPMLAQLSPYDLSIWIGIVVCLLVFSILCTVISGDSSSLWKLLSSLLRQPLDMGDSSAKWRILIGSWSFFVLVVTSCYATALLSFLTIPIEGEAIETFLQLAHQIARGSYKCYTLKGSPQTALLVDHNEQLLVIVDSIKRNEWYYDSVEMGSPKFITDHSALMSSKVLLELFYGFRKDKYLISKDLSLPVPIAIAVNKNFCCKKRLDLIISRIEASGIYAKLLRDESLKVYLSQHNEEVVEDPVKPLTVKDLAGCLVILFVGWGLATIAFVGEILFFTLLGRNKKKS